MRLLSLTAMLVLLCLAHSSHAAFGTYIDCIHGCPDLVDCHNCCNETFSSVLARCDAARDMCEALCPPGDMDCLDACAFARNDCLRQERRDFDCPHWREDGVRWPWPGLGSPPPGPAVCVPGTITTVLDPAGERSVDTPPDVPGDYIAAFDGYEFYTVEAMALGPDGRVYLASGEAYDRGDPRARPRVIYRLEADGTATRVVGIVGADLSANVLQDSVAALEARIVPGAMAFDDEGRLYFVDYIDGYGARLARLEHDGLVTTFAGTGEAGYGGDDGPAREAQFDFHMRGGRVDFRWSSLVFDPEGNLLVLDKGNDRIRRIDRQGVVATLLDDTAVDQDGLPVIHTGQGGYVEMALDPAMNLYFVGSGGRRIFRRRPDGVVERVAGTGEVGFSGDGGPALDAEIYAVGLALDENGALYFADVVHSVIRRIAPAGLIETVAGQYGRSWGGIWSCGDCQAGPRFDLFPHGDPFWDAHWSYRCRYFLGEDIPALKARVAHPERLLMTPQQDLLVSMNPFPGCTTNGPDVVPWGMSHLRRICRIAEYGPDPPTAVTGEPVPVAPAGDGAGDLALQVYPNPANPAARIVFTLPEPAAVQVEVWDLLGRPVRRLAAGEIHAAGQHRLTWDGHDASGRRVASGVYLLRVRAGKTVQTTRLAVVR